MLYFYKYIGNCFLQMKQIRTALAIATLLKRTLVSTGKSQRDFVLIILPNYSNEMNMLGLYLLSLKIQCDILLH